MDFVVCVCHTYAIFRYNETGEISRKVLIKTVDVLVRAKMLPPYEPKFSFYRCVLYYVASRSCISLLKNLKLL